MAYAVGRALGDAGDLHNHTKYRKGVTAKITHDLTVEQHGDDAHGHVRKEGGKTADRDEPCLVDVPVDLVELQGVVFGEEVGQHNQYGDAASQRSCQTCAKDAPVKAEYKKDISKYMYDIEVSLFGEDI